MRFRGGLGLADMVVPTTGGQRCTSTLTSLSLRNVSVSSRFWSPGFANPNRESPNGMPIKTACPESSVSTDWTVLLSGSSNSMLVFGRGSPFRSMTRNRRVRRQQRGARPPSVTRQPGSPDGCAAGSATHRREIRTRAHPTLARPDSIRRASSQLLRGHAYCKYCRSGRDHRPLNPSISSVHGFGIAKFPSMREVYTNKKAAPTARAAFSSDSIVLFN